MTQTFKFTVIFLVHHLVIQEYIMLILLVAFMEGQKCDKIIVLREYLQGKIKSEVPFRIDCVLNFMMLE